MKRLVYLLSLLMCTFICIKNLTKKNKKIILSDIKRFLLIATPCTFQSFFPTLTSDGDTFERRNTSDTGLSITLTFTVTCIQTLEGRQLFHTGLCIAFLYIKLVAPTVLTTGIRLGVGLQACLAGLGAF